MVNHYLGDRWPTTASSYKGDWLRVVRFQKTAELPSGVLHMSLAFSTVKTEDPS